MGEPWKDIHSNPPLPQDGDSFGKVRVRTNTGRINQETKKLDLNEIEIEVSEIDPVRHCQWLHTDDWHNSHEPYNRTVTQFAVSGDYLIALASDGTLWKSYLNGTTVGHWRQITGDLPQGYSESKVQ